MKLRAGQVEVAFAETFGGQPQAVPEFESNVLSIGAALGVVVWVFQQGHLAGWFGTMRLDART